MAKFPISGAEIPKIDLREISIGELSDLTDPTQPEKDAQAIVAKASRMDIKDVRSLKVHDYRALVQQIFIASWQLPAEDDPKN
jgi:hypothetical protein